MSRGSRLTIWCIALLLSLSLFLRGRVSTFTGEDAAFFHPEPGKVTVRLCGDFPQPGLYRFAEGVTAAAAIKMTLPEAPFPADFVRLGGSSLASGDIVTLSIKGTGEAHYWVTRMAAKERMLLGIPLNPDLLQPEEWDALPGIGPVLAQRIVADRQKNGAFGSIEGLLRVPGIGPAKLAAVRKYF